MSPSYICDCIERCFESLNWSDHGQARLKYKLAGKSRSIHSQSFEVSDCLCIGPWPYENRHASERLVIEARTAFPTKHH